MDIRNQDNFQICYNHTNLRIMINIWIYDELHLKNKYVETWDMSKCPSACFMFAYVTNKIPSKISVWDMSSICNTKAMFKRCNFVPDISEWDLSSCVKMEYMFEDCHRLNIPIAWNVNMRGKCIFKNCYSLKF